jgi:hypothetical protein
VAVGEGQPLVTGHMILSELDDSKLGADSNSLLSFSLKVINESRANCTCAASKHQ